MNIEMITMEEIGSLQEGRKTDLLIAKFVMQWPEIGHHDPFSKYIGLGGVICADGWLGKFPLHGTVPAYWRPSIEIRDAWDIVLLRGSSWSVSRRGPEYRARCVFYHSEKGKSIGKSVAASAELAICQAALFAVMPVR